MELVVERLVRALRRISLERWPSLSGQEGRLFDKWSPASWSPASFVWLTGDAVGFDLPGFYPKRMDLGGACGQMDVQRETRQTLFAASGALRASARRARGDEVGARAGDQSSSCRKPARLGERVFREIVLVRPLPGDARIEFVVRCRLGLRVDFALPGIDHFAQRRPPAGVRGGGDVGSPRYETISRTAHASVMEAMMRISPPQRGQTAERPHGCAREQQRPGVARCALRDVRVLPLPAARPAARCRTTLLRR